MTEKRFIYSSGVGFEILDSYFGYIGDDEPTEQEIEEWDYLVIGLASNQDSAEGICRKLNELFDENKQFKKVISDLGDKDKSTCMNTVFNLGKKNMELSEENKQLKKDLKAKDKVIEMYYKMMELKE